MKRSGFVERLYRAEDERCRSMIHLTEGFYRQLMCDLLCVAMRENGVGADRVWKICDRARELDMEFAEKWQGELCTKDAPDKKGHAREWLQRKLEKLCGERVIPWEERYEGLEQAWELCFTSKKRVNE